MRHFRWIGFCDVFSVLAQLHKMKPYAWQGESKGDEGFKARYVRLLRHHNAPTPANWLENLPLHDTDELQKWRSMETLLAAARKAIYADEVIRPRLDPSAPHGRVMLSMLRKGDILQWHADTGPYHDRHARFHISLLTNPFCQMQVETESVHMPVGNLWFFNNRALHTATNFGTTHRVHLIFEEPILVRDELAEEA